MKVSNLAVIFVAIAFIIVAVLTNYLNLQRDVVVLQKEYDTKLIDSTKEAIEAFEINTVEWNSVYGGSSDSKRRSVLGSINTFTTSLANNMNISGSNKEAMLSYIPAIAYTMYDGYYIYSPTQTRTTIRNDDGIGIVYSKELIDDGTIVVERNGDGTAVTADKYYSADNGKVLYRASGTRDGMYKVFNEDGTVKEQIPYTLNANNAPEVTSHILKPYAAYTEEIKKGNGHIIINYTLDNYVYVYGTDENGNSLSQHGYLTNLNRFGGMNSYNIENITFNGSHIETEYLEEKIAYVDENDGGKIKTGSFRYVFEAEGNQKVYFIEPGDRNAEGIDLKPFTLDRDLNRIYVNDKYKKILFLDHADNKIELYQNLKTGEIRKGDDKDIVSAETIAAGWYVGLDAGTSYNSITKDYYGKNYCIESYVFTKSFNGLALSAIEKYEDGTSQNVSLIVGPDNDPEVIGSRFYNHKKYVIKKSVEDSLNQAITSYSRRTAGEFMLPKLKDSDWDQVLTNVSIIAFLQNIPIGLKQYNNYAIATSTTNNEYIDPEEFYISAPGDENYHQPYCEQYASGADLDNAIGYRSVDYVAKTYTVNGDVKTYYSHSDNTVTNINSYQKCYDCLVENARYEPNLETANPKKKKVYNTALARERYRARNGKFPPGETSYILDAYCITDETNNVTGTIYIEEVGKGIIGQGETPPPISITNAEPGTQYRIYGPKKTFLNGVTDPDEYVGTDYEHYYASGRGGKYPTTSDIPTGTSVESSYTDDEVLVTIVDNNPNSLVVNCKIIYGTIDDETGEYAHPKNDPLYNMFYTSRVINMEEIEFELSKEASNGVKVGLQFDSYTQGSIDSPVVWANMDDNYTLTIVTENKDANNPDLYIPEGYIRLKFAIKDNAGDEIYEDGKPLIFFSEDIFKVEKDTKIACVIHDAKREWYKYEWEVSMVKINNPNSSVTKQPGKVQYYTIDTGEQLQEFSDATNAIKDKNLEYKMYPNGTGFDGYQLKTANRSFYLINHISLTDIKDGNMNPINSLDYDRMTDKEKDAVQDNNKGDSWSWFDGYFCGTDHSNIRHVISNATIKYDNGKAEAYGLFGRLGGPSTVEKLTINNLVISEYFSDASKPGVGIEPTGATTQYIQNGKMVCKITGHGEYIGIGGLAGYADYSKDKENAVNDVTVQNSTIRGTSYSCANGEFLGDIVGGLIGQSKKTIKDCTLSGGTVKSSGHINGLDKDYLKLKTNKWYEKLGYTVDSFFNNLFNTGKYDGIQYGMGDIYVGGIVGRQLANSVGGTISGGAEIGNGDVTAYRIPKTNLFEKLNWWIEKYPPINRYYVGGIAAYTTQENSSDPKTEIVKAEFVMGEGKTPQVKGGAVLYDGTVDASSVNFTGGVVGFNNGINFYNDDNKPAVIENVKVTGFDNVGGVIGLNNAGNLSNIIFKGSVAQNSSQYKYLNDSKLFNTKSAYGENMGGIVGANEGTRDYMNRRNSI